MDWLRIVGVEAAFDRVKAVLIDAFGNPTGESGGAQWFRGGINWHPGVTLSYGHSSRLLQLDIRGERLAIAGTDFAIGLMTRIYALWGNYATRIDAALDFVGQDRALHRNALESCRAGELCRMRRFADDSEYSNLGEPTRLLLKLGKRESAVCGRVYDKGLQKKCAPVGYWERFEIEFKDDRARTLADQLRSDPSSWDTVLAESILGAVDFRVRNGRSEIERRPRSEWWRQLVDEFGSAPIRPVPPDSSIESWWRWARASFVARFIQIAAIMEIPPSELFNALCLGVRPAESDSPAVLEVRSAVAAGQLSDLLRSLPDTPACTSIG